MKQRKLYFDTIKLFAIFVVFTTHFIADFHAEYFDFWTTMPTSIILRGVTGKFGVSIFSVILGYFAFHSKEPSITKYTLKRYFYFFLCGLFINSVYAIEALFLKEGLLSLKSVVIESILLGSGIYPTFWCIRPFFVGSILSRVNKSLYLRNKIIGIVVSVAEIVLFISTGYIWIAICIMGNLVPMAEDSKIVQQFISNRWLRSFIYVLVFFAIKRSSSDTTFLIDGVVVSAVLMTLSCSDWLIRPLNCKFFASQGRNTMAIYMIHVIIYLHCGEIIINSNHFLISFFIAYAISWISIVLISYPVTFVLDRVSNMFSQLLETVFPGRDTDRKGSFNA